MQALFRYQARGGKPRLRRRRWSLLAWFAWAFALMLCAFTAFILPAPAVPPAPMLATTAKQEMRRDGGKRWLLPHERTRHSLNQIYEFDRSALGRRLPVILVPGRAEEFQQNSWWKSLNRMSAQNEEFTRRFKLYVFLYDSKKQLAEQAQDFGADLKLRFGHLKDNQPLMLVTYSLGGVISREVLKDDALLKQLDTMIAIAVPFHGSPIFDPEWFSDYLNPPNRSPVRRFWDRAIYRGYMFNRTNLTAGLKWDNFDGSKPQFTAARNPCREVQGDQAQSRIAPFTEYPNADAIRSKTVVYGSYLANGYTDTPQPFRPIRLPRYVLGNALGFPKEAVASVLPFYGFSVHSVFTYMNNQLANLPSYTPEDPQGQNTHLYRYNDGGIPVSSMLFLKASREPYSGDLQSLAAQATVRKTRIFLNLDHTHLGEYALFKRRLIRPDVLHPGDGERSPHQWIIDDLLERAHTLPTP